MPPPIRHLPVLQNWDCHVCGTCCKEYQITVTDEERRRIELQGWDQEPEFQGVPLFTEHGPPWRRTSRLNHRPDDSCVFLNDKGRCRIHEKFGYETKPLACRLFPFVLVPAGDHWRVGMRYACPSAAENRGRPLDKHDESLIEFARMLAEREGLQITPQGFNLPPPTLHWGQRVSWPDFLAFVQALLVVIRNPRDRLERRLRKCVTFARLARQARFQKLTGPRLIEFLEILVASLEDEVPKDPATLGPPSWVGRILFRQALALFSRKDQGPNRGAAVGNRFALLGAALRFARGKGAIPRLHGWLPEATFEQVEAVPTALTPEAEQVLERYYAMKIGSLQFCGPAFYGMPLWDGLEVLALTFPVLLWLSRFFTDRPRAEAVTRVLSIVDDHFGFNRVLGTRRQRLGFSVLARLGELEKLIAWYGR